MEYCYAIGIRLIISIQDCFRNFEEFFSIINSVTSPNNIINYLFPVVSIFDSVYASDLLAVVSFAHGSNCILKWILNEDRPYWWIKETRFYTNNDLNRPKLYTNFQTCETGPGNPSGHVMSTAVVLTLIYCWSLSSDTGISKKRERNFILVTFIIVTLTSMSRMFVSAHFPHQCAIGYVIGVSLTHMVYSYYVTPYMNLDEKYKDKPKRQYNKCIQYEMLTNICLSLTLLVGAVVLYWIMKLSNMDPIYSIKYAFKWCPSASYLHHTTTPFFAIVLASGSMLGWSLCVTPSVKSYRYDTEGKSYLIAILSAVMCHQIFHQWQDSIPKNDASYFYIINLLAFTLRPFFFIRVLPMLSMCRNKWEASKQCQKLTDKKNK